MTVQGEGNALVTTSDGQIGRTADGTIVNTVPDADFVPIKGELNSKQHPIILLPADVQFTVEVEAKNGDEPLKISVANPDYSVVIDGLIGQPGQLEELLFDPISQLASFTSEGEQEPSFQFTYDQDGEVFSVQTLGLKFDPGEALDVAVDSLTGSIDFSSDNLVGKNGVLVVPESNFGQNLTSGPPKSPKPTRKHFFGLFFARA